MEPPRRLHDDRRWRRLHFSQVLSGAASQKSSISNGHVLTTTFAGYRRTSDLDALEGREGRLRISRSRRPGRQDHRAERNAGPGRLLGVRVFGSAADGVDGHDGDDDGRIGGHPEVECPVCSRRRLPPRSSVFIMSSRISPPALPVPRPHSELRLRRWSGWNVAVLTDIVAKVRA